MADTTPNLGLPLIDLTEPDADSLAEGATKLRTALITLDTVYQQLANSLQSPDATTLGGQNLAYVLNLANATGLLPIALLEGFDAAWDAKLAQALDTAPATLDTLLEIVAEVQSNESAIGTITGQLGTLQTGLTEAEGAITTLQSEVTALQSGGSSIEFFAAGDPLPTSDQGPIWHAAYNSIMTWQVFDANGANYTGYASAEIGRPSMDGQETPRVGYFKRNGDSWSQGAYAALWHWALHTGRVVALGSWTQGESVFADNGDGTFRLPDTRSEFERAWDDGRGVDSGRVFGSAQSWAIQNITGSITINNSRSNITGASGAFSRSGGANLAGANGGGSGSSNVAFNASSVVQTANETRPRSVAHLADIKF